MEYEKQILQLSSKLDEDLQRLLYANYNYLPTITSTFQCIENSSEAFKVLVRNNFSLESSVKEEIGKVLSFYINVEESIEPPFTKYFSTILTSLVIKEDIF